MHRSSAVSARLHFILFPNCGCFWCFDVDPMPMPAFDLMRSRLGSKSECHRDYMQEHLKHSTTYFGSGPKRAVTPQINSRVPRHKCTEKIAKYSHLTCENGNPSL